MVWQIMEATNLDSALGSTSEIIPSVQVTVLQLFCCTQRAIKHFSSEVSRQNSAVRLQLRSSKGDVLFTVKIFHSGYHACDRIQELIMPHRCFL